MVSCSSYDDSIPNLFVVAEFFDNSAHWVLSLTMIKTLSAKDFKAVPYLETSSLMVSHPKGLKFSTSKPNVIVGPNGSGKSALLSTLALQTLSYFTGESSFDGNFISSEYWSKSGYGWSVEHDYLPGLRCSADNAPALYYRPGHIPGNECGITHAMMCGYFDEAKAYARLVKNRSSGQQSQSLLEKLALALTGESSELSFKHTNWGYGKALREIDDSRGFVSYRDHQAETLKKIYGASVPGAMPVLLMDEPEQSLDARAEAALWKKIREVDVGRVQVIVASHSLYPLLHPKAFNLIEAVPGYASDVQALIAG